MLSEKDAATQATEWVRDEVEQHTCLADDDSQKYAEGFVTGMIRGILQSGGGSQVIQGPTAENFWRGNLREALAWERQINV